MGNKYQHYLTYYFCALFSFMFVGAFLAAQEQMPEINNYMIVASGVLFFGLTLIAGILTESIYYVIKRVFFKLGHKDEVLDSADKKRMGIMALLIIGAVLKIQGSYVSFMVCIVLICNYFTWVIPSAKELKDNVSNLFRMDLETFTTTVILIIISVTYLIIDSMVPEVYQIPGIIGLIVGMSFALIVLLMINIAKNKKSEAIKQ